MRWCFLMDPDSWFPCKFVSLCHNVNGGKSIVMAFSTENIPENRGKM